jgi:lipoate-protein ligase B
LRYISLPSLSDYREVWDLQLQTHAEVLAGTPDTVIFCEHKPVVTIGKAGGDNHLLTPPERLRELGIDLVHTDRGGDITYHGPGQLVIYPIFDLKWHYQDVHRFLRDLEEVAIRVMAEFGVEGFRVEGRTGVWTNKGKIAAIGVHVRKWVTYHGMAFNVTREAVENFRHIIPCGIADGGVTSLEDWGVVVELSNCIDLFRDKLVSVFLSSK